MPPGLSETIIAKELLHQFSSAQRIRTLNYKHLEKGFEACLLSRKEADYKYATLVAAPNLPGHVPHPYAGLPCRAVMAEVTLAFQVCSETINTAQAGLRRMEQHDLADMLRVVQTNEHEKLRLTLILQALRQSYAQGTFSWISRPSAGGIQTESGTGIYVKLACCRSYGYWVAHGWLGIIRFRACW